MLTVEPRPPVLLLPHFCHAGCDLHLRITDWGYQIQGIEAAVVKAAREELRRCYH